MTSYYGHHQRRIEPSSSAAPLHIASNDDDDNDIASEYAQRYALMLAMYEKIILLIENHTPGSFFCPDHEIVCHMGEHPSTAAYVCAYCSRSDYEKRVSRRRPSRDSLTESIFSAGSSVSTASTSTSMYSSASSVSVSSASKAAVATPTEECLPAPRSSSSPPVVERWCDDDESDFCCDPEQFWPELRPAALALAQALAGPAAPGPAPTPATGAMTTLSTRAAPAAAKDYALQSPTAFATPLADDDMASINVPPSPSCASDQSVNTLELSATRQLDAEPFPSAAAHTSCSSLRPAATRSCATLTLDDTMGPAQQPPQHHPGRARRLRSQFYNSDYFDCDDLDMSSDSEDEFEEDDDDEEEMYEIEEMDEADDFYHSSEEEEEDDDDDDEDEEAVAPSPFKGFSMAASYQQGICRAYSTSSEISPTNTAGLGSAAPALPSSSSSSMASTACHVAACDDAPGTAAPAKRRSIVTYQGDSTASLQSSATLREHDGTNVHAREVVAGDEEEEYSSDDDRRVGKHKAHHSIANTRELAYYSYLLQKSSHPAVAGACARAIAAANNNNKPDAVRKNSIPPTLFATFEAEPARPPKRGSVSTLQPSYAAQARRSTGSMPVVPTPGPSTKPRRSLTARVKSLYSGYQERRALRRQERAFQRLPVAEKCRALGRDEGAAFRAMSAVSPYDGA